MNMREKINKHESEGKFATWKKGVWESEVAWRDGVVTFQNQEQMHWHQSEDDVEIWQFAKRFLPIKGLVSEAAGRGGLECSGVPKNCYMIEVTFFSLFNPNLTIFRRYYKMQFRLKSFTNNKNMYRNQIWFNLKIKDAWKTYIVPDILSKYPWNLLYTFAVWTPEYVLNCIRVVGRYFTTTWEYLIALYIQYSLFISSPLRRGPMELKFQPIMSTLFLSLLSYLTPR